MKRMDLSPARARRSALLTLTLILALGQTGCFDGGSSSSKRHAQTGVFIDSPVAGLGYVTESRNGLTDAGGAFEYRRDERIAFHIGDLQLGEASGADIITPLDLVPDAEDHTDDAVTNIAVLLQTLDQDGNASNGITLTPEISDIVSLHADRLVFDTDYATFAAALGQLLDELNAAEPAVFTDTFPGPRTVVAQADAQEHLARALAPQKVVDTEYGKLSGFQHDDGSWAWYGVPYAKPPVGDLRFRPPVKPDAWEGVRWATGWADQSAQNPAYVAFGEGGMSEDSLYLNVTVPDGFEGEKLPVMVWFHGGGFAILTGNTKAFNNTSLPKEGVVVVTVNHRLGPLGYMAHPALTAESPDNTSGNYGQLDLVAALEWVRDNIEAFGGDPDNVTIAEALGVQNEEDVAAALRAIPWPELVAAANASGRVFSPNVDGVYMLDGIRDSFAAGTHNDVPIMAGANQGDTPGLIDGLKWYMPWMADDNEADVFAYVFDHLPDNWSSQGSLAYHGAELVYVFDYPGSFLSHYLLGLTGLPDPVGGDTPTPEGFFMNHPGWNPNDVVVTDTMRAMWANFARTGNPSIEGLDWPAYTSENDTYLRITPQPMVETGLDNAFPE